MEIEGGTIYKDIESKDGILKEIGYSKANLR